MSTQKIRVMHGSKLLGPMTREALAELLAAGRVAETDLVSESNGPWVPLTSLVAATNSTPSVFQPAFADSPFAAPMEAPLASGPAVATAPVPAGPAPIPAAPAPADEPAISATVALRLSPTSLFLVAGGFVLVIVLTVLVAMRALAPTNAGAPVSTAAAPAAGAPPAAGPAQSLAGPPVNPPTPKDQVPAFVEAQPNPVALQPAADPTKAVAILCGEKKAGAGRIALMTIWAVDKRHLAASAFLLADLSDPKEIERPSFKLFAVAKERDYEVTSVRYHPKFPAAKLSGPAEKRPKLSEDEQNDAMLNNLAVLEVGADLSAWLPLAERPGLDQVTAAGQPVTFLSAKGCPDTPAKTYRPAIESIPGKLLLHPAIPTANDYIAGIQGAIEPKMEGSPVLDGGGAVVGVIIYNDPEKDKLHTGTHAVLSSQRVRELIERRP